MTPKERQLVNELFDRLAKLENSPRDAGAERAITAGLVQAPHAVYALVQTVLVQDRALRQANARIEELQSNVTESAMQEPQRSFLGNASDDRRELRGSSAPSPSSISEAYSSRMAAAPQAANPPGPPPGSGISFLGNAASAATGAIGGGLLLRGIRSMLGKKDQDALGDSNRQASALSSNTGDPDSARDSDADHTQQGDQEPAEHSSEDDADLSEVADQHSTDDSEFIPDFDEEEMDEEEFGEEEFDEEE